MEKKFDVALVGTLNVDLIIRGRAPQDMDALLKWADVSEIYLMSAGSAGYCGIDMARLGLKVCLLSNVADDVFGHWILEQLQSEKIETSGVEIEKGHQSGIGVYMLLFGSGKRPLTARLATHAPWQVRMPKQAWQLIRKSRLLHCSGYLHYPIMWEGATEDLFKQAKREGLITSLDPQFPIGAVKKPWIKYFGGLLKYVDLLLVDEDEALNITGARSVEKAIEKLGVEGPQLIAVKCGEKGAIVYSEGQTVTQPIFEVKDVKDTIGAGDAFDAGIIYAKLKGMELKEAVRFASAVAAITVRGIGGTQTAPSASEVKKFLRVR